MSWISKLIGSDAKKRNQRKLQASIQSAYDAANAGVDPASAFGGVDDSVKDWVNTNNRINYQTGLKSAGAMIGTNALLGGGAGAGAPAASNAGGLAGSAPAAGSAGGGGSLVGGLKSAGGWLADNPEFVLGGLSAYQGAKQQGKANQFNQEALDLAKQSWNETAALRAQALKSLMEPKRTDLSNIYAGSSNPFMRSLRG